jgi:hypothetical protein
MNLTLKLLRQIGTPFETGKKYDEPEESEDVYNYAFKNRIGILYLLKLKNSDCLEKLKTEYENLSFRAKETMVTAAKAGKILSEAGIDYVIFKTIRPYPATPNDVDIVCLDGKVGYKKATDALFKAGYFTFQKDAPMQILFSDPHGMGSATWDKKGGIYYVDLYKAPAVDYFIYLDPEKMRNEIVFMELDGFQVKVLRPEVELAAILMHSVFPEKTFTLELFYSISYSFSNFDKKQIEKFLEFSRKNNFVFPVRICLTLTSLLHTEAFGYVPEVITNILTEVEGEYRKEIVSFRATNMKTPYNFLVQSFFISFLKKLREPVSLKSLGVQCAYMLNPFFLKDVFTSLYKRITKGTYEQV